MAQTTTELFNLAAQALGSRGKLASVQGRSRELDVFNLWFPFVRSVVYSAAHWPSVRTTKELTPVSERVMGNNWSHGDPAPGARYGFRAPPDMLHPRRLSSYGHFTIEMVGGEKIISTHENPAILSYTFDQTDVGKLEPQLFLLLAQTLAAYTCTTITGRSGLARQLENQVNNAIIQAQATSAEIQNEPLTTIASWHAARGYVGSGMVTRFVYPYGGLVAVGESAHVK